MKRSEYLEVLGEQLEGPIWAILRELDLTLQGLARTAHFDLDDDGAVGSAVHSALPRAVEAAASAGADGIVFKRSLIGPGNKIFGTADIGGGPKPFSAEFHLAGPKGGTGKGAHQFAGLDGPLTGYLFDEFEDFEDPSGTLLLFVAYMLSPSRTTVQRAWLVIADGLSKEKIELRQIESGEAVRADSQPEAPQETGKGVALTLKVKDQGVKKHDGSKDQRK